MFNFPNNPSIGDIVQFPDSPQQYVWNGNSWNGAPLSAQFITGSGGGSSVSASHALNSDNSISASYAISASHLIGYSQPILIAGPGISVDGYKISASVLTVNGSFPDASGNITTALTNVITGTSSSLILSASGDVTSSLSVGDVWVISGDTDPSQNGVSYIYSFDGTVGAWLKLSSLDQVAADNRYLMLTPQSPLTGPLSAPFGVTGSLLGSSSYAATASVLLGSVVSASYAATSSLTTYALTASHIIGQLEYPILLPDGEQSSWLWGAAYAKGNEIRVIGSVWNSRPTGLYNDTPNGNWINIPINNRPTSFTKLVVDSNNMYALGSNGLAYTVGENNKGQLGRGPDAPAGQQRTKQWSVMAPITASSMSGSGIQVLDMWHPRDATNALQDSFFSSTIYKVLDNGVYKYYGTGFTQYGQLGIGLTTNTYSPTEIVTLRGRNIVSMSMGSPDGGSTIACEDNGTPWTWGFNGWGQLGVGNTTNSLIPIQPKSGSGLAAITGVKEVQSCHASDDSTYRYYNMYMLKTDGTVLASGTGVWYLRGDGQNSASPNWFSDVRVNATTKLTNIVKLYCRGHVRTALDASGNLWGWGTNNWSWMGDGTADAAAVPYAKIIATGVEDVHLGGDNARTGRIFIKRGGVWYGSGYNNDWCIPIGYKWGGNLGVREQLELPQGTVKDFFPIGIYAGGTIGGYMTQMSDDTLYANGYLNNVLPSSGYSSAPIKLRLN